ncbi:MAG: hypothetical protein A2Y88_10900 [Chloroflexi bacterium RBG_13_48_10]|nr:MAG: hypothetical protein A2Y88_10900 [Chloroflexi bacterium RBG_13_48_10]
MMIKAEGIHFKYEVQVILDDISVQFEKGYLYGILGPNGCGKTTFLKILSGLLRADHGHVVLDNLDINKLSISEIAKKVAVVPDATTPIFDFSVEEIVTMGRYIYVGRLTRENAEEKKIVREILRQFNLVELKDRSFNALSAGERQKVIIARAIAQQSKILLLDEPTSHLDINYQVELMEMLKKYVKNGLIVVAILHDLNLAGQYCNNVLLIRNGKIQAFGTPEMSLTRENIKLVYNVDVVVRKNPFTNSIYVTPISPRVIEANEGVSNNLIKRIHVVAGGGTSKELLPELRGNDVSVGIVNTLDDDYEFALELKYEIIAETPFSPISEKSQNELMQKLNQTDIVILVNVPFGKGNLENLKILENCIKPLIILEKTPIETRDFTEGMASEIYNRIKSKTNVKVVKSVPEIMNLIDGRSSV